MFVKAKAFSDFVGFHVRLQFVMLSALFVLAPIVVELNKSLRAGTSFATSAGPIEYVAVTVLFAYGLVLFIFICLVGSDYIRALIDSLSGTVGNHGFHGSSPPSPSLGS